MIHHTSIVVRYAETDQMGIVHHSVYPIWYEVARTELIRQIGISYTQMEAMGVMTPLVELKCRYKGVTRYEDQLTIHSWVSKLSPASVEFTYEVYREGEKVPCNVGYTLHAWVDAASFRPINMKKRYPEIYSSIEKLAEPRSTANQSFGG